MSLVITESPRDAIQGLHNYIPVQVKADYINCLLKIGFDIIDAGSFVSGKSIPQLKDTAEVLQKLDLTDTHTKIMILVANARGIETAVSHDKISWLAFPYSVSPTFLKLNINADFQQGISLIESATNSCLKHNKSLKVYLTMAFGNPYNDIYDTQIVFESVAKLHSIGIRYITLSDITGVANKVLISQVYSHLISAFPDIEFGLHLHTTPDTYYEKVEAAYKSGCISYDAVINGMGGCPMTGYELVSNLNTIDLMGYCNKNNIETKINKNAMIEALKMNSELFGSVSKLHLMN